MERYERPEVVATYSIEEVRAEAKLVVACSYVGNDGNNGGNNNWRYP